MKPELSDAVDSHIDPLGSAVHRGRRNLFPGRRNGSKAAQIVPENPERQRPTTETAAAAGEGVIETPWRWRSLEVLCGGPCGRQTPAGPYRKNQNKNRSI